MPSNSKSSRHSDSSRSEGGGREREREERDGDEGDQNEFDPSDFLNALKRHPHLAESLMEEDMNKSRTRQPRAGVVSWNSCCL